jgi:hypothetical protein
MQFYSAPYPAPPLGVVSLDNSVKIGLRLSMENAMENELIIEQIQMGPMISCCCRVITIHMLPMPPWEKQKR